MIRKLKTVAQRWPNIRRHATHQTLTTTRVTRFWSHLVVVFSIAPSAFAGYCGPQIEGSFNGGWKVRKSNDVRHVVNWNGLISSQRDKLISRTRPEHDDSKQWNTSFLCTSLCASILLNLNSTKAKEHTLVIWAKSYYCPPTPATIKKQIIIRAVLSRLQA